jgi:Fur family transcriptional regulator, zinc uptake regulator
MPKSTVVNISGAPANRTVAYESTSPHHDHASCVQRSLQRAERAFVEQGRKLTPLRRRVLEEIAASHDAVGAYDVLDRLAAKSGTRIAPISVYRALDVLQEAGVIHRLESRNAFFACHTAHRAHQLPIILVCDTCDVVTEVDPASAHATIDGVAARHGFTAKRTMIEVAGSCSACKTVGVGAQ